MEQNPPINTNLRPKTWDEYLGQKKLKQNLSVIINAAKKRNESLEHLLFYGNSGLGKTTLAHIISNEMQAGLKTCSGPSLERSGDVASLLTNLEEGDILFIDECHRINRSVEEMLYSAMEDFKLHIIIGKGPMARTMDLDIPRFTLIGATTRLALLSSPFRNRFGATFQFPFYEQSEIEDIIKQSARILLVDIDKEAISSIAQRSRLTPRVSNRILKRVRDFATIKNANRITLDVANEALSFLEIDELGLEIGDRKILTTIINSFSGGPVGIKSLAATCAEEEETILDIYEPFLIQSGFIKRTPKGRVVTKLAYEHLNYNILKA